MIDSPPSETGMPKTRTIAKKMICSAIASTHHQVRELVRTGSNHLARDAEFIRRVNVREESGEDAQRKLVTQEFY